MPGPNARGATEPTSDGGVATANRLSRGLQAAGAVLGSALALGPTSALADGPLSLSHLGSTGHSALIAPPIARAASAANCPPGTVKVALTQSSTATAGKSAHFSLSALECPTPQPTTLSGVTLQETGPGSHHKSWRVNLHSGETIREGFNATLPNTGTMQLRGKAISRTGKILAKSALLQVHTAETTTPPAGTAQPGIRLISEDPAGALNNVTLQRRFTLRIAVVTAEDVKNGFLGESINDACDTVIKIPLLKKGIPTELDVTAAFEKLPFGNPDDGEVQLNLLGPDQPRPKDPTNPGTPNKLLLSANFPASFASGQVNGGGGLQPADCGIKQL